MLNPRSFDNQRPEGGPTLVLPDLPDENDFQRVSPLQSTRLEGEIGGPLARLELIQVFQLPEEGRDGPLEALYRFPLAGEVALQDVEIQFGDHHLTTELQRRRQAREEYEQAKEEGRQAALLSQESEDVFTLRLAGLKGGQRVEVATRFLQLARVEQTEFQLRVPLTVPPRFVREDEQGSRRSQGQPLGVDKEPTHDFQLDLTLTGGQVPTSSTHDLEVQQESDQLRLTTEATIPNRDLLISWQPDGDPDEPLQVFTHEHNGKTYFLGLVCPPDPDTELTTHPREVGLLVDHSGSMSGPKWEAADWGVLQFLERLEPRDRFGLGSFESRTHWFDDRRMRPAQPDRVQRAKRWVKQNTQSGGTQLGRALEEGLEMERAEGEWDRHVLILTDAQVSDTGRLLRLADREQERTNPRRISVICIDSAPNSTLAGELARRGGGEAHFLSSDPSDGDITTALENLLRRWEAPIWREAQLITEDGSVEASRTGSRPEDAGGTALSLGPIRAGQPRWIVGRTDQSADQLTLSLEADGQQLARYTPESRQRELPGLHTLFGAYRLSQLEALRSSFYSGGKLEEQLQQLGYQLPELDQTKKRVYPEHQRQQGDSQLAHLIGELALEFELLSTETALVAVGKETGEKIQESVAVANALPQGWSDHFVGGISRQGSQQVMRMASASPTVAFQAGAEMNAGGMTAESRPAVGESDLGSWDDNRSQPEAGPTNRARRVADQAHTLWSGQLTGKDRQTLFARTAAEMNLTGQRLAGVEIRFPDIDPSPAQLRGSKLVIYLGNQAQPQAQINLVQLQTLGGKRPLNLILKGELRIELRGGQRLQGETMKVSIQTR